MKSFFPVLILCFFSMNVFATGVSERIAVSAPKSASENIVGLVRFLTQTETDKRKQAEVMAIWIASHISYDNYTYAAALGQRSGKKASARLARGEQDAESVLKNRIATCEGYANLYEKMLSAAGIRSEKVFGYVMENKSSAIEAKKDMRSHRPVGHVWTMVHLPGGKKVLVDVTWMSRGQSGQTNQRLTPVMKNREIQQIKRSNQIHPSQMKYFDFSDKSLQQNGEYRFSLGRTLLR